MTNDSVDEFALVARLGEYLAGSSEAVPVPAGDDAAVLAVGDEQLCVTVDVLVDEVHFRRDLSSWADVGWKAVAVNVSDLAAMAARPAAAVVGLCRADLAIDEVEALYSGMREACRRWGMELVGGDTVASREVAVTVTAVGAVVPDGPVRRSGARPGDRVVVVGGLGAAAAALAQVEAGQDLDPDLLARHRRPVALVEAGLVLAAHGATAMIDVSDGLGADLGHVCAASSVAVDVAADRLPIADGVAAAAAGLGADADLLACGGGEDFALAAAVPARAAEPAAAAAAAAEGVPAAVVGSIRAVDPGQPTVALRRADGTVADVTELGWAHVAGGAGGGRGRVAGGGRGRAAGGAGADHSGVASGTGGGRDASGDAGGPTGKAEREDEQP